MVSTPAASSKAGQRARLLPPSSGADVVVLSEETNWAPEPPATDKAEDDAEWVFWLELAHVWPHRVGLVTLAGAGVVFEPIDVAPDTTVFLTVGAALSAISDDGLDVIVLFRPVDADGVLGDDITLLTRHIARFDPSEPWVELCVPVGACVRGRGAVVIECGAGPRGEPSADWLAIYELVVGPAGDLALNRARCHRARRYQADMKSFEQRYYVSEFLQDHDGDFAGTELVERYRPTLAKTAAAKHTLERIRAPATSPFEVGNRALARGLRRNPPDFKDRLARKVEQTRKLRVLSLCCGVGRIERTLPPR